MMPSSVSMLSSVPAISVYCVVTVVQPASVRLELFHSACPQMGMTALRLIESDGHVKSCTSSVFWEMVAAFLNGCRQSSEYLLNQPIFTVFRRKYSTGSARSGIFCSSIITRTARDAVFPSFSSSGIARKAVVCS